MSQYNQLPYQKPTGLNKVVMVILVIAILMSVFLTIFYDYEESIEQAGFKNIVANFTDKILLVLSLIHI